MDRNNFFSKSNAACYAAVIVVFCLLSFFTVPNHITLAQSTTTGINFVIYENLKHGIKIAHPSNWKTEEGTIPHFSVSFIAPTKTNSTTPPALLRLGVDSLHSSNVSLAEFTNDEIASVKQEFPVFTLWQLNSTTVNGNVPAKQLIFSATDDKQHEAKAMQVFVIKNNKSYHITYIAKPERYAEFLPTAKKMIDSFRIKP